MRQKLYEFSALINYHLVVAAATEVEARAEIKTYEKAWLTGDFIAVSDVELVDVRKPTNKEAVIDEAHIIV